MTRTNRRSTLGERLSRRFYRWLAPDVADLTHLRRVYFGVKSRILFRLALLLLPLLAGATGLVYYFDRQGIPLAEMAGPLDAWNPIADGFGTTGFFLVLSAAVLVVVFVTFGWLLRGVVQNLKKLEQGALQMARGNFDKLIEIESRDELGRLADILNSMAGDVLEKESMKSFFSLSARSMIRSTQSAGEKIAPGTVQRREMSFLFTDVRDFTAFAEVNDPEVVIDTLNLYFRTQYDIIRRHRGDVDDYVGDQIMAHFTGRDHRLRACQTAVALMAEMEEFNAARRARGLSTFEVGAGVHSGVVVTGNVGTSRRMDFACIGDAVNATARLCALAAAGEILVSREHMRGFADRCRLGREMGLSLKGKKEKFVAMRLFDIQ
ncbi:MAG: adenylate/guanylate cyclase domain-containing protein [Acidobacteria bacterium]|nr:adenylate/guanylate cyclase domain-containing protein [Acidobacteriota bacterium]